MIIAILITKLFDYGEKGRKSARYYARILKKKIEDKLMRQAPLFFIFYYFLRFKYVFSFF